MKHATLSRVSKNIVWNLTGQGLILVLGFFAVKFVFRQLGEDAFGIIYFSLIMGSVLCAVLELGLCSTMVREVSSHLKDDPTYIGDLIRTASFFYWSFYVLLALGVYFGAPFLVEKWVNLTTIDTSTATRALRILGIATALILLQRFYASLFRGLEQMQFSNAIDVGTLALQQVGTLAILFLGGGLIHVSCWLAVGYVLSILVYLFVSARYFSWQALIPKISLGVVKRNLEFSSRTASISALAIIHTQADKVILSKLLPIGIIGYYGVAYSLATRVGALAGAIPQASFPFFSALFKAGDRPALITHYRKLQDLVCLATVPIFAGVLFAAGPLFAYIFNEGVASKLFIPMAFLCLGSYMHGAISIPYFVSLAVGRPDISAKSNLLALIVVLPVTTLLIFFFGLPGAAFSWVFYHLFTYAYAVPRMCSECLEISTTQWYLHQGRILVLACITYGVAWFVPESVVPRSNFALVLAWLGSSIVFATGAYWLMGSELKAALWRFLQTLKIKPAEIS